MRRLDYSAAMQRPTAVAAYFKSKQLLLFAFARQNGLGRVVWVFFALLARCVAMHAGIITFEGITLHACVFISVFSPEITPQCQKKVSAVDARR